MAIYIGENRGKPHLGEDEARIKDNFTSLDWDYIDGQFLFSINNITPELAEILDSASNLELAVIRYLPANVRKRSRSKPKLQKTYPRAITESNGSGQDIVVVPRMGLNLFGPDFKLMDFTSVIEGLALNDNNRFRHMANYATTRTAEFLLYNWRDYGFAIVDHPSGQEMKKILESPERLRMMLLNQEIGQYASEYIVVNKKEIQIIE